MLNYGATQLQNFEYGYLRKKDMLRSARLHLCIPSFVRNQPSHNSIFLEFIVLHNDCAILKSVAVKEEKAPGKDKKWQPNVP